MCDLKNKTSVNETIKVLCETAKIGLNAFYPKSSDEMPYSTDDNWGLSGDSIRYAAISQIGIVEWLKTYPEDTECLPDLWPKISDNFQRITHIGDFALVLWAAIVSKADNYQLCANGLVDSWKTQADSCNAVELGWIVQACTLAIKERADMESSLQPLIDETRKRLGMLFEPKANLFRRHDRKGFARAFSRRVACFADQVYPILALSTYGDCFDDTQSVDIATRTVAKICELQGTLGQWWWHYDTHRGTVCEEYPVFSVHQDAMAPMAILASDRLSGHDHSEEIELGMRWLFEKNELDKNMVLNESGIVLRDIEKREPEKASRNLRALLCVSGLRPLHYLAGKCYTGFHVNYECRPYHLGWILYAWANHNISKP